MLSFSLINEVSPYYPEPPEMMDINGYVPETDTDKPSFLGKYLTHTQPASDDSSPVEDNKYVKDELGDVRFSKDGDPLEKSDVGVHGFMKRLVGKPTYDQPQNDSEKTISSAAVFSDKHKFPKILNYNKRPPEEQLR